MGEAPEEEEEEEEASPPPPPRLRPLPDPAPLAACAKEVQKERVKELERKLRSHARKAVFSEDEAKQLLLELEQLKGDLLTVEAPPVAAAEEGEEGELASSAGARGPASRRLVLKREIREIERKLKAHKKQACLSKNELSELGDRLEELKAELSAAAAGPTSRAPQLLTLRVGGSDGAAVTAALGDRASIAGLPEEAASALFEALAARGSADGASEDWDACGASWSLQRHHGMSSGVLRGTDAFALAAELEDLSLAAPHLLCVRLRSLRARGGVCAVLRDYRGAVLLLEEGGESELEVGSLLNAVAVRSRWRLRRGSGSGGGVEEAEEAPAALERAPVPEPVKGEVLGDLKARDVKDLSSSADLGPAVAEADVLCQQEFGDELVEPLAASDGVRMGLLVSSAAAGPGHPRDFLGFVLYKFWGPPLKAMSISRVAVPAKHQMQGFGRQLVRWAIERAKQKPRHECTRVTLCSLPKAIPFYERLNFTLQEEDEGEGPPEIPGAVRMEYNYGRQVKG